MTMKLKGASVRANCVLYETTSKYVEVGAFVGYLT